MIFRKNQNKRKTEEEKFEKRVIKNWEKLEEGKKIEKRKKNK